MGTGLVTEGRRIVRGQCWLERVLRPRRLLQFLSVLLRALEELLEPVEGAAALLPLLLLLNPFAYETGLGAEDVVLRMFQLQLFPLLLDLRLPVLLVLLKVILQVPTRLKSALRTKPENTATQSLILG